MSGIAGVADRVLVEVWDKVERIVGDEKHCKKVDLAVRQAIEKALLQRGLRRLAAPASGAAGRGASRVCAAVGPRNRTILVLAGAAAGVSIFGLVDPDEVWPGLRESLKNARVPLTVPLAAAGLPGTLTFVAQPRQAVATLELAGGDSTSTHSSASTGPRDAR